MNRSIRFEPRPDAAMDMRFIVANRASLDDDKKPGQVVCDRCGVDKEPGR